MVAHEQVEVIKATDVLAQRVNQVGHQVQQESLKREQAMNDMEARWKTREAQIYKDLEPRMEARIQALIGYRRMFGNQQQQCGR